MTALRLVQFTDTHLVGDPAGGIRGVATRDTLARVIGRARSDLAAAEAVLLTGDVVHDDASGYDVARELLAPLGKPIWCLPGNHDEPGLMRAALDSPPFAYCPVVDRGAWRIVLLDSVIPGATGGALARTELDRLERALTETSAHVLVVLHHQPLPARSRWLDPIGLADGAVFVERLQRFPGVRGVLWGHVHQAHDETRGQLRCLGTPSTCVQFAPDVPEFALDDRPPAYRRVTLHADGRIDSDVVWC